MKDMQRKTKNIIAAVTLTGLLALTATTVYLSKSNTKVTSNQLEAPPNNSSDTNNAQSSNSSNTVPPNGNSPSMPNGSIKGNMPRRTHNKIFPTGYYVAFGAESLTIALVVVYLIISKGNKKTFKEVMENKDCVVAGILAAILMTAGESYVTKHYLVNIENGHLEQRNTTNASGSTTVTSTKTVNNASSSKSDESAVLVKSGGKATITGKVTKSSDATNTESSEFNGVNAAVLVQKNGTATIKMLQFKQRARQAMLSLHQEVPAKSLSLIPLSQQQDQVGQEAWMPHMVELLSVRISKLQPREQAQLL